MAGDAFDIRAPFIIALASFMVASIYARVAIPYMTPDSVSDGNEPSQGGLSALLVPLKIVLPQRLRLVDGRVKKHYGIMFLCGGLFLGVVSLAMKD